MSKEFLNPIGCMNNLIKLGFSLEVIDTIKHLLENNPNDRNCFCEQEPEFHELITSEIIGNMIFEINKKKFPIKEISDVFTGGISLNKEKTINVPENSWQPFVNLLRYSHGSR